MVQDSAAQGATGCEQFLKRGVAVAEALCFVEQWNRRNQSQGKPLISFCDISQSVTRMPCSTLESEAGLFRVSEGLSESQGGADHLTERTALEHDKIPPADWPGARACKLQRRARRGGAFAAGVVQWRSLQLARSGAHARTTR